MAEAVPETVSLFRAVTAAEREDILRRGGFSALFGGMECKQFATSLAGAHFFGTAVVGYYDEPGYFIVEVEIPEKQLQLYHLISPDGWPACTVFADQLERFNRNIKRMIWHE